MKVLLTGCSRGLGLELTRQLLALGHQVIGVSRKDPGITHSGFQWFACDLGNERNFAAEIKTAKWELEIDVLIHNAGIGLGKLSLETGEEYKELMAMHLGIPMLLSNHVIQRSLAKKNPLRLILISSICVHVAFPGLMAYSASKAAMEAMGRSYAREWGRHGIDVLSVCPDYMETDMTQALPAETLELVLNGIPDRIPLKTSEVAKYLVGELGKPFGHWRGKSVVVTKRPQLQQKIAGEFWVDPNAAP